MKNPVLTENTQNWRAKEVQARRAIEDHGFVVHDANIIFRQNCPNIDLVVYAQDHAFYVQVKSSKRPAGEAQMVMFVEDRGHRRRVVHRLAAKAEK
jgi:Holliday junction resolvase-like predicted endonuclease